MACKCKERRAKLQALREKRLAKGRNIQAAALGAVLAVTDKVAQVVGIDNGEVVSERDVPGGDAGGAAEGAGEPE